MSFQLPRFVALGISLTALFSTACQKKAEEPKAAAVELVKPAELSPSFLAVNRQLELGGSLYGYVNVEGDVQKITGRVQAMLEQMGRSQPNLAAFAKQDYSALAATLGLTDIKALGVSSVGDGTGFFRNRMFLYTGGERHGLLAGLGGKSGPFTHLDLAPADVGFYAEAELDLPVVYRAIKEVVAKVGGEPTATQLETELKKAGEAAALSVLDLIYGLKGRSAVVLRTDPVKTLRIPAPPGLILPGVSLLVCIDGIAAMVEPSLAKIPALRRTDAGALHVYEFAERLPLEGVQPVIVLEGNTLYLATSKAFYDECRAPKSGLAQSAEFKQALTHVGTEGNGLTYVSPRFFEHLRKIEGLNPQLPAEAKSALNFIVGQIPSPGQPLVAVRTNLPDGILVRSYLNRSLKQDVAMVAVYNPVTVGLLAAMAIPAFQKVRMSSQETAVLNNLRQLSAAADQFYLERGVRAALYADLVGLDRYIPEIRPVMGENYRQLRFAQGQPLQIRLPNGKTIQYPPAGARQGGVR